MTGEEVDGTIDIKFEKDGEKSWRVTGVKGTGAYEN